MIKVGLTGGFGSGKSTVREIMEESGIKTIDADVVARKAAEKNTHVYRKIVKYFGRGILESDGAINRGLLGDIVFGDKKKLAVLNRIVHPYVIREIRKFFSENKKEKIVVAEVQLLFEAGLQGLFDRIIVVHCGERKRMERIRKKFKMTIPQIRRRFESQMSENRKKQFADYIIDNNGNKRNVSRQTSDIISMIANDKMSC